MKKLLLLALAFSFSTVSLTYAQSTKTQKEVFQSTYNSLKALVKTQQYTYAGEVVYNNKNREILNAEENTIKIDKTTASGTVTSLSTEKKTFDLNGTISDYTASFDDAQQIITIEFKVQSESQTVNVFIDVRPNGNAFLTASVGGSNSISWTGRLK